MDVYDSAHSLARVIRDSEEARDYKQLKEVAEADETNRALLAEYKRLQMALQLQTMSGETPQGEDMQRFSQISSLLFMNSDVQAFLLAEMRLQKMMGDVFKIVSEAAGLNMDMMGA